jgi:hypothetical protein
LFKKTITFKNFNDEEVTQDFYFHMSKAELLAMAADVSVMMARIQRIIDAKDGRAILQEFRDIIEASIGMKSEDGSRFIRDGVARSQFMDSPAYDELLMELCASADAASQFIQNLIPEKMQEEMHKQLALQKTESAPDPFKQVEPADPRPAWIKEGRNPTHSELKMMDIEEMRLAFQNRITE